MTTLTIKKLESDTDNDRNERKWYEITGTDEGTGCIFHRDEFAICADGTICDDDGWPVPEGDSAAIAVRRAIESLAGTIAELDEHQLVVEHDELYSVVRYCPHGNKYYAYAGCSESEARERDCRILDTPAVRVIDSHKIHLADCACGGE